MARDSVFGNTAIVGVGTTDFHDLYRNPDPGRTAEQLGVEALRAAMDDAGLRAEQIDGLVASSVAYPNLAFRAGLRDVRFLAPYPMSGRMCAVALAHASLAVQAGMADYVALVYATNMRSVRVHFGGNEGGGDLYDPVFGLTSPGAFYALAYEHYLADYGLGGKADGLGEVSVAIREHASMNPEAVMQSPLDLQSYLDSRFVARPLRLFDYCLVTDGAVCYIVTTLERARDLRKPPVRIAAFSERAALREHFVPEDLWAEACAGMADEIFERSGLERSDVDSLQVYDNFSVSVLWALEGFGFCGRGEALDWVQGGRIRRGGELPVNTSGGMMSEAYMQGWNHHAEAIRQVRGECGERQVPDCGAVLYACLAPVSGATLLTRDA